MSDTGVVKPTILAFHGSGSNATIHTVQLARLNRVLKDHFNVESLEGMQHFPNYFTFFFERHSCSDDPHSYKTQSSWGLC